MSKKYPPFIEALREIDPELFQVVSKNMDLAMAPGKLDAKTKILITLALDAIEGSGEGVKSLAGAARSMGVSDEEIKETIRLAYMTSANRTLVAGLSAFNK
ncbi:carboxymuconolactone decarboxylase family protein [Sporosalibacterium faouarense]|uniref:carboxymuconolactone decarboxylase family protein n=1 Tax=Sporosalibacterium faouarense TaxID=516123 RepID=UPI00141CA801|nr:carboxymuconolactone decarboxylase family protein [Sporosalibacterium faouarense]MTI47090.1 carboxymuconolactone decarboxylase family protein [Bacillota bacterium]